MLDHLCGNHSRSFAVALEGKFERDIEVDGLGYGTVFGDQAKPVFAVSAVQVCGVNDGGRCADFKPGAQEVPHCAENFAVDILVGLVTAEEKAHFV